VVGRAGSGSLEHIRQGARLVTRGRRWTGSSSPCKSRPPGRRPPGHPRQTKASEKAGRHCPQPVGIEPRDNGPGAGNPRRPRPATRYARLRRVRGRRPTTCCRRLTTPPPAAPRSGGPMTMGPLPSSAAPGGADGRVSLSRWLRPEKPGAFGQPPGGFELPTPSPGRRQGPVLRVACSTAAADRAFANPASSSRCPRNCSRGLPQSTTAIVAPPEGGVLAETGYGRDARPPRACKGFLLAPGTRPPVPPATDHPELVGRSPGRRRTRRRSGGRCPPP